MKNSDDGTQFYALFTKILDSARYGLPQNRKRLFIVALQKRKLKAAFKWPKPCKKKVSFQSLLQKDVVGGGRSLAYMFEK